VGSSERAPFFALPSMMGAPFFVDDIRSKFGSKYDTHIKQMLDAFGFSE